MGQTCDLETVECLGGNRCLGVSCGPGTTCDPEDGKCHCGEGGPVCGESETCRVTAEGASCRTVCDPVAQTPCAPDESCIYDTAARLALCTAAGPKGEGTACGTSEECGRGMHCVRSGFSGAGACRLYCARGGACSTSLRACRSFTGASAELAACLPCQPSEADCTP